MSNCPTTFTDVLNDMLELVRITKTIIDQFFPPAKATAPIVTKMSYGIVLPPRIYVLLIFADLYPGTKLNPSNVFHLLNLKDIYFQVSLPWEDDPILSDAVNLGII